MSIKIQYWPLQSVPDPHIVCTVRITESGHLVVIGMQINGHEATYIWLLHPQMFTVLKSCQNLEPQLWNSMLDYPTAKSACHRILLVVVYARRMWWWAPIIRFEDAALRVTLFGSVDGAKWAAYRCSPFWASKVSALAIGRCKVY